MGNIFRKLTSRDSTRSDLDEDLHKTGKTSSVPETEDYDKNLSILLGQGFGYDDASFFLQMYNGDLIKANAALKEERDHGRLSQHQTVMLDDVIVEIENEIGATLGAAYSNSFKGSYHDLARLDDDVNVVVPEEQISCAICLEDVEIGQGVRLKECLHEFCRECLIGVINISMGTALCPHVGEGLSKCNIALRESEVRGVLSAADFQRYQDHGLNTALGQEENAFHCKTPHCPGCCILDKDTSPEFFLCLQCLQANCLLCDAIHVNQTCEEFKNSKTTETDEQYMQEQLSIGEVMKCPGCGAYVQKSDDACDALICPKCKLLLCWVTKKQRRGPNGCQCMWPTNPCHPDCRYCH